MFAALNAHSVAFIVYGRQSRCLVGVLARICDPPAAHGEIQQAFVQSIDVIWQVMIGVEWV